MNEIQNNSKLNVEVVIGGKNVTIYPQGTYKVDTLTDEDRINLAGHPVSIHSPFKKSFSGKKSKKDESTPNLISMNESNVK